MKGYKAFKKGMVCMGKQYQENTVFEEAEAKIHKKGMHFCKEPLDVLDYYPLIDENGNLTEFAEVEALDEVYTEDNRKYCTKKLKIKGKIDFVKLVQESVKLAENKEANNYKSEKIGSSSDYAKISSSSDYATISSNGNGATISSNGNGTKIGVNSNGAKISTNGYGATISSNGYGAHIGANGNGTTISSNGNGAKISANGDCAKISTNGNGAQIGASSDYAKIGVSGYNAQIGASGYGTQIISNGKYSVICCAGNRNIARAKKGSWITLSEWEYSEEQQAYIPICVKTRKVDGKHIKADTFYELTDGKFVEVGKE